MEVIFKFLLLCLFSSSVFASDGIRIEVSDLCLRCICDGSSNCNRNANCEGPVCGPYRITYAYWLDAGSPMLNENDKTTSNRSEQSYRNCVNNTNCAARAVRAYMRRYARDCNGDGLINCDDYARIHRNGPLACSSPLDETFRNAYNRCMRR